MMKKILIIGVLIVVCVIAGYFLLGQQIPTQPAKELKLSDFPEAFKENTVIVTEENASQVEKESAEAIAANLENLTGNKPEIISSKKIESFKYTHNLIIVGTPKSNEVIWEVYNVTDAIRVTEEYPGEGKGILEILRSPWNEDKAMLLVEGSDEWEVKAGSEILEQNNTGELDVAIIVTEFFIDTRKLAEDRAKEEFAKLYEGNYPVILEEIKTPWAERVLFGYTLYKATYILAHIPISPSRTIALGKQNDTYVLPSELTNIIRNEGIEFSNATVLDIAKVYIQAELSNNSETEIIFLNHSTDIPWDWPKHPNEAKNPSEFKDIIVPPTVYFYDNNWIVELYTYEKIDGLVKKWIFNIAVNYQIHVDCIGIANKVGDYSIAL